MQRSSGSTPSVFEFRPEIAWQRRLINDVLYNYDYSLGTHVAVCSGSVGCLREDEPVETIFGLKTISDITSQDYVLSLDPRSNQFSYVQGSGGFPKAKGSLYRVIHERGEFVASGNHLILSSRNVYQSVDQLRSSLGRHELSFFDPLETHLSSDLRLLTASVLRSWNKVLSLISHCEEGIHQCDPQLQSFLDIVLDVFPLLNGAQEYGLFSFSRSSEHWDDLLERARGLDRLFQLSDHQSTLDSFSREEDLALVWADEDFLARFFEHIIEDSRRFQRFLMRNAHPITLLSILYRICIALKPPNKTSTVTNGAIKAIEKVSDNEWFWDMQVPYTNNYVSGGLVHHNSGKSLPAAHLAVRHCLEYSGARVLLGRKALPDLKDTIFRKVVDHLQDSRLKQGSDYRVIDNVAKIVFRNGSEVISRSWSDRKYKKLGSLELSAAIIEEGAENDDDDKQAFEFIKMRVGRLPHIKQNWLVIATNPDEPDHWLYKDVIGKPNETTHVYYSKLIENPYLPESYERNLRENMDPLLARRMLDGEWISIIGEGVYHAYSDKNRVAGSYTPDPHYPVLISWDFNIADGKPLSACVAQRVGGVFHIYGEVIVEGMNTAESCDELAQRGFIDPAFSYEIHGDATGRHRDTRSNLSDWDIIRKFFANHKVNGRAVRHTFEVPRSNPPVRKRHNIVNATCLNANGEVRLLVYDGAETVDQGFRMTKLKKGGQYVEDDSKAYQHVTTAVGYMIHKKVTAIKKASPQFL